MFADRKVNVLVTGVGAIIGYGVIKSLKKSKYDVNIVGMDIYDDAVGQHWCDKFIQAIYAVDDNYISFLKKIIDDNKIDIVFFGTEQEIYRCETSKEELGDYYNKLVINKNELLELSKDKWKTREALLQNGLEQYAIPSVIEGTYESISEQWGKEFLLKPRSSYASKGIHRVDNKADFDFYSAKMGDNFMAQRLIGDNEHEYTVGAFGLDNGDCAGMIQLKRKLSQEGATVKAESIHDPMIEETVKWMCRVFKPVGPTNFQFRKDGDNLYLLEVNPRISSSTSIRMAFGYNEAEMCIGYFLAHEVPSINVKNGRATRFIDEVVLVNE